MDVSIILCTKNRVCPLEKMLNSLKEAVEGITYELIVVEGNSSDNTLEILNKFGEIKKYDELVRLGKGWHPWPKLYNFGFSNAQGKWAMYASDDITFNKNCFSNAVKVLNKQNNTVAGGIFFYRNTFRPGLEGFRIDYTYGQKFLLNYGLIRLDYFREVGGLDEAYRFYCADGDLCLKLYKKGKQFIPLPDCFVEHRPVADEQRKLGLRDVEKDIDLYRRKWASFVDVSKIAPKSYYISNLR